METLKEQLPLLDFSDEIAQKPELEQYIRKECSNFELTFTNPMEEETAPKLDTDFSNYVLLCGLPIVDDAKKDKLLKALTNILKKKGNDFIEAEDITILLDSETGKSYGTAFIKCKNEKEAKLASASIHNFALGKANTIMSSTFDEFERLVKIPDDYTPPKFADLTDLYDYAMDPQNDQFMIREDNRVKVKLNRVPNRTDKDTSSPNFHDELVGPSTDLHIVSKRNALWSPQGRYLVVFKDNLVQLYGGSHFELIREIIHTGVTN